MLLQGVKNGFTKYFIHIISIATFSLCGTGFYFIQKTIYAIFPEKIKTRAEQKIEDATVEIINDQLVKCNTDGIFIGLWKIDKENNHLKTMNQYLSGTWHNNTTPENTRLSNPVLYLKDLEIDKNTANLFYNALESNSFIFMNESIAKQNNYEIFKYIFENLDLKKEGFTLEGIYLKPETKGNFIWIFSMSFVKLEDGGCYQKNNEKVVYYVMQSVIDKVKRLNNIK